MLKFIAKEVKRVSRFHLFVLLVIAFMFGIVVNEILSDHTMTEAQAQKYCTKAEVYMLNNVQEDDLFIPASSIGKVDLKR